MKERLRLLRDQIIPPPPRRLNDTGADKAGQMLLLSLWAEQKLRCPEALPALDEVHLRAFSQNYEDGALLLLFSLIGATNRTVVEMCAGNGIECNSANLIVNHGWTGLLLDGDADNVATGQQFYTTHADTWPHPPTFTHAWITRDNVNDLVRTAGIEGEIDLFSLDLDGVDYWLWEALDVIEPRVVIVEYNDIAGPDRTITVPYDDAFVGDPLRDGFVGASLGAYIKLAKTKGYRLVGVERWGFNAFFVKNGVGDDLLPERSPHEFFDKPKVLHGMATRWPRVADRPWVEV
jgi:hypothetical protein